ncbi:MAG: hypothetical protein AAF367_19350 [Pseudomonadota bacterium]
MSDNFLRPYDDRYTRIKDVLAEMLGEHSPTNLFGEEGVVFLDPELSPQGIIRAFDAPTFKTSEEYRNAIEKLKKAQRSAADFRKAIDSAKTSLDRTTGNIPIRKSAEGGAYPPVLTMALVDGLPTSAGLLASIAGDQAGREANRLQEEWDTLFPKVTNAKGLTRRKKSPGDKRAYLVAHLLARIFAFYRSEPPKGSMDSDSRQPYGPYMTSLEKIFKILGIETISVRTPGQQACSAYSDDDFVSSLARAMLS